MNLDRCLKAWTVYPATFQTAITQDSDALFKVLTKVWDHLYMHLCYGAHTHTVGAAMLKYPITAAMPAPAIQQASPRLGLGLWLGFGLG